MSTETRSVIVILIIATVVALIIALAFYDQLPRNATRPASDNPSRPETIQSMQKDLQNSGNDEIMAELDADLESFEQSLQDEDSLESDGLSAPELDDEFDAEL